jgi:signal transduction histidine kinase
MSDIVWAVDPKKDRLGDLVHRMRRFASDALDTADIQLVFAAPAEGATGARLRVDVRREVFLIFKESTNNILKHSGARRASIELAIDGDRLRLTISDDGRGFDAGRAFDGNGLDSIRRRARRLRSELAIESAEGRGTRICLETRLEPGPPV